VSVSLPSADLSAALVLYERIALSLTRSADSLGRLTLMPSALLETRLAALRTAGLVEVAADRLMLLAPPERLGLDVESTRRLHSLRDYWLSWQPSYDDGAVLHGPRAYWEHWWTVVQEWGSPAVAMDAVMPDANGFVERNWLEYIDRDLYTQLTAAGFRQRMIVPSGTGDGEAVDLVDLVLAAGHEVRVLDVPEWFTVYGDRFAVVPEARGDAFEGYARLIRTWQSVALYAERFEALWRLADPWGAGSRGAGRILRLLASGHQDEEIAILLGISERTVRRRVAEEMDRYGVRTRLQLGTLLGRLPPDVSGTGQIAVASTPAS
jgi:hypothetical protein